MRTSVNRYNAVVTGAGSGIGRAIACALAQQGMNVLLIGRDVAKLECVAAAARDRMRILPVDLSCADAVSRVVAALEPQLHVLVHSAGLYDRGPVTTMDTERWAALDRVNVYAPMLLTAGCLEHLRAAKGQVVFVNSSAGLRASPETAAYAAGKHALKAAVDVLRQEVNPDGIRVLSIFPGRTDTPMQQAIHAVEGRDLRPETLMRPEDVASMILAALALPRSAEVTDIIMRPMQPL